MGTARLLTNVTCPPDITAAAGGPKAGAWTDNAIVTARGIDAGGTAPMPSRRQTVALAPLPDQPATIRAARAPAAMAPRATVRGENRGVMIRPLLPRQTTTIFFIYAY